MSYVIGILAGILVILSIWFVQRTDLSIGTLKLKSGMLIMVLSVAGAVLPEYLFPVSMPSRIGVFPLLWMLLFASYTDRRSGMVYSVAVNSAAFMELFLVIVTSCKDGISKNGIVSFYIVIGVLLVLGFVGLARADCFIYFTLFCYFFLLDERFAMIGFLGTVLCSSVYALIIRITMVSPDKRKDSFPFTAFICGGYYSVLTALACYKFVCYHLL